MKVCFRMRVSNDYVERLCEFVSKTIQYVDYSVIRFFADNKYDLIPLEASLVLIFQRYLPILSLVA